jgi:hypothetical protein
MQAGNVDTFVVDHVDQVDFSSKKDICIFIESLSNWLSIHNFMNSFLFLLCNASAVECMTSILNDFSVHSGFGLEQDTCTKLDDATRTQPRLPAIYHSYPLVTPSACMSTSISPLPYAIDDPQGQRNNRHAACAFLQLPFEIMIKIAAFLPPISIALLSQVSGGFFYL